MSFTENQVRMPESTEKRISELMAANELRDAIPILMDILNNYYRYEKYRCVKFDPDTGEKLLFDWRPESKFNWHIPLHEGYSPEIKFHSDVAMFFKQEVMKNDRAMYFTYGNQAYVITRYWGHYYSDYVCEGIKIQHLEPLPV